MNRKLLVTLLQKNIEELNMITEGFIEMNEYPSVIINLARRKTEDIQTIISQLAEIKHEPQKLNISTPVSEDKPEELVVVEEKKTEAEPQQIVVNEAATVDNILISAPDPILTERATEEVSIETVEENIVVETETETEITIQKTETVEHTETVDNHELKVTTNETTKTTIADKIIHPTLSRNEMLSKSDNSLSATIANKKISDIKQAISIGDRFRFQRELFKGNGEEMNKTLNYINQLATLDEVLSFLKSKYGWEETNEAAEDFYQIVRRKF